MREARVREPPVVVVLRLAQRGEEARFAGGEKGERGVVEAVGGEDEAGYEMLAAVDGGREAVCERDPVERERGCISG